MPKKIVIKNKLKNTENTENIREIFKKSINYKKT